MFLKRLFKILPSHPLTEGLNLYNAGRNEEAIELLKPLLASEEEAVRTKAALYACEAHLERGDQLASTDPVEALAHYQEASRLQPTFADIHNKVGEVCRLLGRLDTAEMAFRRSLEINPRFLAARLNLLELLLSSGRVDQGAGEVERLLQDGPPLYHDALLRLRVAIEAPLETWRSALAEVRSLTPSRLEVARQSALAAIRRGQGAAAAHTLEGLLSEYPRFPDLHHLLGLAYGEMGRDEDAVLAFQKALEINPRYVKARINLGISLLEQGRPEEAERELRRVLEVDPTNPLVATALEEIGAVRGRD